MLRTLIKSPNISGRCHCPTLLFKQMGTQGHSRLPSASTRDYCALLLTALWHVFRINYLAIIRQIFSELFVFLSLKCHMSVSISRAFFDSTPKPQVWALGPSPSPTLQYRQASCHTEPQDLTVSFQSPVHLWYATQRGEWVDFPCCELVTTSMPPTLLPVVYGNCWLRSGVPPPALEAAGWSQDLVHPHETAASVLWPPPQPESLEAGPPLCWHLPTTADLWLTWLILGESRANWL